MEGGVAMRGWYGWWLCLDVAAELGCGGANVVGAGNADLLVEM